MCMVIGWMGEIPSYAKERIVIGGRLRGRDGAGYWTNSKTYRTLDINEVPPFVMQSDEMLANFRATPTTEAETQLNYLQPYDGIVHNGIISNDKVYGDFPIDSMALPEIFSNREGDFVKQAQKIVGSYAIAFFNSKSLVLITNYKPIYYKRFSQGFAFASMPEPLGREAIPLKPYTVNIIDKKNFQIFTEEIPRNSYSDRAVVAASSGLDSTTVAYLLKSQGKDVTLAHFIYKCLAQENEVNRILRIAEHGGFGLTLIEIPNVFSGTIVEGTYKKDGISGTEYAHDWVSARNLVMTSLLTAFAESNKIGIVATGGNLEESGAYPDNEHEFGRMVNNVLPYAVQNGLEIRFEQPLSNYMKHEIVKIGQELGVPWHLTWSCYSDKQEPCGKCGPCYMRRIAFERNGLVDPLLIGGQGES